MKDNKHHTKATIVLLTRNSSKTIKSVLDGIIKQKFTDYEILLIDSSSTDDTLKIAKQYPCRVIVINAKDFNHGKTRNYAASLANGEFVVYLTHDSVPRNEKWLSGLLEPFIDSKVAGVYGQQVPRDEENVLDKHFQSSLYGDREIVWDAKNWKQGDNLFSDANSAVRKSVLLRYPYIDDIIVSEDYEWATRVLKLGYNIVYTTSGRVTHSHSYSLRTLFKRNFDVGVSYKKIYKKQEKGGFTQKGLRIVKQEIACLKKSGNSHLIPQSVARDLVRFTAISLGKQEQIFPKWFKRGCLSGQSWYWR